MAQYIFAIKTNDCATLHIHAKIDRRTLLLARDCFFFRDMDSIHRQLERDNRRSMVGFRQGGEDLVDSI